MAKPDYYAVLKVAKTAPMQEIKQAYRRLARLYHPDSGSSPQDAALFRDIQIAYEILSDESKRAAYDQEMQAQPKSRVRRKDTSNLRVQTTILKEEPTSRPTSKIERNPKADTPPTEKPDSGGRSTRERKASLLDSIWTSLGLSREELVEQLEESKTETTEKPPSRPKREKLKNKLQGPQQIYQRIDALESIRGTERELHIPYNDTIRKEHIRIPAGILDGAMLDITFPERAGFPEQSVRVRIGIAPHQLVEREGFDLTVKLPVTTSELLNGTDLTVPSCGGPVTIKLPAQWDVSKRLRIKGHGLQEPKSGTRGDLYLRVYLVLPNLDETRAKELLEELGEYYPQDVRKDIPSSL